MSQRSSSKLTSRSNFSESASSETHPYADTLANKLIHLHEENIQIGKQNQELSARLHEVTTYNQALGLDIYKLDNEINDLEEKIESHREKTNKILHQTEVMNRKTESCKNLLNRNEQMSDLAKKFQTISHFKEKADKNVQELQKLFEDANYEKIAGSFDTIAEKIHFLYWNNNELNEQITMLEKMVSERENKDRTQLQSSWEEKRIDSQTLSQGGKNETKDDAKSEPSPGGACLRVKMKKRIQKTLSGDNDLKEEGECTALRAQSDASKKNEYFMSSDSIENEAQKKIKTNPPQKGDNNNDPNQPDQYAVSSPVSKKPSIRKRRNGLNSVGSNKNKTQNTESESNENNENEYDRNEYDDQNQNQTKFDAENMTPRKNLRYRKQPSPKSVNGEENQINEFNSPNSKSSSTTYSKSSSKSAHSEKSNPPQSPNSCMDTSSQLADSSNSNHSNKTDNNDDIQPPSLQNISDGNVFLSNGRRLSRRKSNFPHRHLNQIKDSDSEYDFYESEPPPNPKKGTVRVSNKDSEYEYEYYDPDDVNEEADDENEYDFVEENTAPPKVIISRPRDALDIVENRKKKQNEPDVVTNYTECEYNILNIKKPAPPQINPEEDEQLINLNSKYDDDDNINHHDKSEYIYIKKSEKTIKEDEKRSKQREFASIIIRPKQTNDELRQEKNDFFDEEQIKKYEENALRCALEDEEAAEQKKVEKESKIKDDEEQFVKKCFKKLRILKNKKRDKMEKEKDDEILSYKQNKNYEKYYRDRITEVINMREERELKKAIEEENENQTKTEIIHKAQKRIENRKKEEEAIKEQEDLQKQHKKEAEEKLIEEKRIKAKKLKEEEIEKLKRQENEENQNKEREKQKRLNLLKMTHEKYNEKIENDRKRKEQEEIENKERERLALEDMVRRRKEKEEKEKEEKEFEKTKRTNEVNRLKSKILKFRQLKEKEKNEKAEEKNNEKEIEIIKQKLREKRRNERELREKERLERERKDRELRELYEGIFDVPVKRIFDKNDENDSNNNNNKKNDDPFFSNSRLGNDKDGFLSDTDEISTSDSMAELDVAAPISLEEKKLANLHDKENTHTHSNCKRIKVKKYKRGDGQESEYEYEYEYEYDIDDDDTNNINNDQKSNSNSKSKSRSRSKLKSKSSLSNFSESESESIVMKSKNNNNNQIDEEEAEQIAFQEQQRLQQLLKQMDNQNSKDKSKKRDKSKRNRTKSDFDSSATFKSESESYLSDASPKGKNNRNKNNNNNDDYLTNYTVENDTNLHSDSSEVIQYSDDDYFPRRKDIVKTRPKKSENDDEYEYEYDESNPNSKKRRKSKKANNNNENGDTKNDDLIIEKNRPLRKKKTDKPEFVPEFYNPKQQPKFKPIIVGTVFSNNKKSEKSHNDPSQMGTIVNEIDNPAKPKPILIENCKIKHPGPVKMDTTKLQIIKTPEQLKKEAEEKAAREERERLHKERAKHFRHAIDANGKEYEYDYEYDYEYETETETENQKKDETSNKKETEKQKQNQNQTKSLHATYRDSTDFFNELSKEVASANTVIKQTTEVIKHKEEEEMNELKKSRANSKIEENRNQDENENKEQTKTKRVRTGRKIKKSPSTATKPDDQNQDKAEIKKQKSVTFANDPANVLDTENQVNFNSNITPSKRMSNSARRQRNSPDSPIIDPTISPNSKQRLSNRRNFSDMSPVNTNNNTTTSTNNNNEEEEAYLDDEDEQISKPANNLLVEIDSRPITPRRPQQKNGLSNPSTPTSEESIEIPNVPELDLSKIPSFVDESEYEYEYEYENDTETKTDKKVDVEKLISESGSSMSNNLLLRKDNSDEDFTENEKAFDSRSNFKLQNLIKQVRADAASLSNEDLQNILTKIKAEIEIELKSNSELEAKLQELEKVRDRKVPKNLSNFSTQILEFEPIIYDSKYSSIDVQTDVPGEFIKNIEATLTKQNKEKQEMVAVQKRIEAAQQQVISIDSQIKSAEKMTVEKKQSIENLKAEIIKVKEEIDHLNYDTTQDDVQAKQCEIEIEKLETQVKQHQQKLEKVSHTIEELQIKLQEMINYRAVLEAELNDMYNREKPEVRKLIEDVRNTKQSSEEAQTKITQLQKKIVSRRDEVAKLRNSKEKKKIEDLRLIKEKLARRLNKWTILNSSQDLDLKNLQEFSLSKASQREKVKNDTYNIMRKTWNKDEDVESLNKYADLLESILSEYNKQTPVT